MKQFILVLLFLSLAAAGRADTFFVANQGVNTITRYDDDGSASSFTNAFVNGPIGLALDRFGNLFVATNSNTIEEFSPAGVDLGTFATIGLNFPMALAFDRNGNLYAANFAGNTVQVFTPAGVGSVFASVVGPTGLAFDANGDLYVSNFGNTIERFASDGRPLGTFASSGLNNPEGLAFDSLGNLYAANNGSGTVEKFSPSGQDLGTVLSNLSAPVGLAFDSSRQLYVVNSQSATITRIDEAGIVTTFANTGFTPAFLAVQTPPKVVNISTRAQVLTGENVLDAGFIITGTGSKPVLIRALGPSLSGAGVPGALADPTLEVHSRAGAVLASNDNWKQTQRAAIEASGIPPTNDAESAVILNLVAGSYTVIERGKAEGTGVGLVEVYDLARAFGPEVANISTRGFVGSGSNVMIAGFIVSGVTGGSSTVVVRALGPSLGGAGVGSPLADPVLGLYDGDGNLIVSNDNWRAAQEAAIQGTGVPPPNDLESAIVATLPNGPYTAIESGKDGDTGVGLVEVYNLH